MARRLVKLGLPIYAAAVFSLIVVASATAAYFVPDNSVRSRSIINGTVKTRDLAAGAVNSVKLQNGTVVNEDIAAGAAIAASKINATGLNADMLDGKHADAFVGLSGDSTVSGSLAASDINYSSVKTGYVAVPGSALMPEQSDYPYSVFNGSLWSTTDTAGDFEAPVSLPDGAQVINFRYVAWDFSASNSDAQLMRHTTAADGTMADVATSGTPGTIQVDDSSIVTADIDNSQYSYYIKTTLVGGTTLEATMFIITYTYISPGS